MTERSFDGQPFVNPVVCLNAWMTDDRGDCTYADPETDEVEGWGVYVRWHDKRGDHHPYHTTDESDHPTREEALAQAETLAAKIGCEVQEY